MVSTPIGNHRDITLRALDLLAAADTILCEDTRNTRKLLTMHGISGKLMAYHEHNAETMRPKVLSLLEAGAVVALVSDAGTPLVSDPGFKLVRACRAANLPVTALPGPSALLGALTLSGLPSDQFFFAGFPPAKPGPRRKFLDVLRGVPGSLIVYESTRRLPASLAAMAEILGPREACVARELTKLHEELRNGPLDDLAAHFADHGPPKGEVVVVIGPAPESAPDGAALDERLAQALAESSLRDAVAQVAAETGQSKKVVYARALELTGRS